MSCHVAEPWWGLGGVGLRAAVVVLVSVSFATTACGTTDGGPGFPTAFEAASGERGMDPAEVCDVDDRLQRSLLAAYGAMFVAERPVEVPPSCLFPGPGPVEAFQDTLEVRTETLGDFTIRLQAAAFDALEEAIGEVEAGGGTLTPRNRVAGAREFDTTVELWDSRLLPGLAHWRDEGRLSGPRAREVAQARPVDQVRAVLALEADGMLFSKGFDESILASVAPPGSSQHLSLLAFDVEEHRDRGVRQALADHGWFQTVADDEPHFTYLGIAEDDLESRGLRRITDGARTWWVPDLEA